MKKSPIWDQAGRDVMWRISQWFSREWWRFLLARKSPDVSWWTTVRCRASGHKCGPVYYAPSALEPDWHCKNCEDLIG